MLINTIWRSVSCHLLGCCLILFAGSVAPTQCFAQEADGANEIAAEVELGAEAEDVDVDAIEAEEVEAQPDPKAAEATEAPYARLVRVPLPIQGSVDTDVRRVLEQVLAEAPKDAGRPIVVLEFWPPTAGEGGSSEFGRSLDLARFLAGPRLAGVRTVAYIPKTIRGHAVLVALATEQIIMHPDAQIGAAGAAEDSIDPTVRRAYQEIAERRRTIPAAIALGMLDPELQVQRLTTGSGVRYSLSSEVADIQKELAVQSIDTVIPAGEVGLLAGDKLRLDYGFVSHLAQDRQELAASLNVPASDLEIDPSFGGTWNAVRVNLHGAVTATSVNRVMSSIDDRLARISDNDSDEVNFICVSIDSPGGSTAESIRLANYLAGLDSTKVRTVAFVSDQALADAGIIAIACDQLAMGKDAYLGGYGARQLDEEDIELATIAIRKIAEDKNRSWSLPVAIVDPELELNRYTLAGSPLAELFCEDELAEQEDPDRWKKVDEVSPAGELLQLTGTEAKDLGLARHVVDNFADFRQKHQLDKVPEVLEANWAHELIGALATPQVAGSLLFIGFFAMIAEMSAPGLSIGGFIAALCFLLFFWSNFLQGTAGWLEVLLFMGGIVFIAMEIFVLPGFGIFGLGGGFMVLASLVLASQTFVIPQNEYQFDQLPRSMFIVLGAIAGVGTSCFLLRNYLANSPMFRRAMLAPPEGAAALERQTRESVVRWDHLMGKQGRAKTPLVPAGKADFDGELIDVVSDGLVVDKNATVVVIEVAGNRVVVRECAN